MKYAPMAPSAPTKVTIPRLNGGLNVYDVPNRVADNQLTDCDNLWWYRGALRTRPGLTCSDWREAVAYTHRQVVDERTTLAYGFYADDGAVKFDAAKLSDAGFSPLGYLGEPHTVDAEPTQAADLTAMGIRARKNDGFGWYYLLSNGEIIRPGNSIDTPWVDAEPYIPTVLINGVGEEFTGEAEPSVYEDYNRLTRAFQCHFTTDGTSTTWKLPMKNLATNLPGVDLKSEVGGVALKIELDVCGKDGAVSTIRKELTLGDDRCVKSETEPISAEEAGVSADEWNSIQVEISFNPATGVVKTRLYGTGTAQNVSTQPIPGGLPFVTTNNLRITAWRGREYEKDRLTICKMTRGTWYGGDGSGIAGGTRFFVCGNPDEPDLLCWSDKDQPLYFPELNRSRVGDTHSAITALGKQSSLLVVYKEHEIYGMQYLSSDSEDYDFATSGGVAVTSYTATFALMPINAGVGCDCPDTVRLTNNRLVWACSDGSVYMLTATNQYSERNVRMISRNVRDAITACGKKTLKNAMAAELEGYYLLIVGHRVFLMNTQTSAFGSFSYYDDEDAAAKAIPWFTWTLPEHLNYISATSGENAVLLAVTDPDTEKGTVATLDTGEKTDNGNPIPCRMATKLWDFGIPDYKKSVEQMYVGLRCEDLPRLQITYVTDRGSHIDPYRMKDTGVDGVGYCPIRRLTPNVRMVQAFGIKVDSDAAVEMDGITVKFRKQGVVR